MIDSGFAASVKGVVVVISLLAFSSLRPYLSLSMAGATSARKENRTGIEDNKLFTAAQKEYGRWASMTWIQEREGPASQ
jgi:hypothetical protein